MSVQPVAGPEPCADCLRVARSECGGVRTIAPRWLALFGPPPVALAVAFSGRGRARGRGLRRAPRLDRAQGIVFGPGLQGGLELRQGLTRVARANRAATAFDHQVPHVRRRRLVPAVVGRLTFVRHEVKEATSNPQMMLLGLECRHLLSPVTGKFGRRWRTIAPAARYETTDAR